MSTISWYLFSSSGIFNIVFSAWSCSSYSIVSCFFILDMDVLPKHGDHESSHDTSVVASHVDHVVGLSVLNVSQVSSLGQNVVNLFFFPFWRDEGGLFLRCLPEHRIEGRVIL